MLLSTALREWHGSSPLQILISGRNTIQLDLSLASIYEKCDIVASVCLQAIASFSTLSSSTTSPNEICADATINTALEVSILHISVYVQRTFVFKGVQPPGASCSYVSEHRESETSRLPRLITLWK